MYRQWLYLRNYGNTYGYVCAGAFQVPTLCLKTEMWDFISREMLCKYTPGYMLFFSYFEVGLLFRFSSSVKLEGMKSRGREGNRKGGGENKRHSGEMRGEAILGSRFLVYM